MNTILTFANQANVGFIASWKVWRHGVQPIELHGTLASIRVPDPYPFGEDVELSANARLPNIHNPKDVALLRKLHEVAQGGLG